MQREVVAPQDVKLGLVPQQSDGQVMVKDVSRGGWAEGVGINAGTRIVKLNGLPVQGMSDTDFKAAMKQRPLKILLEQDTFELLVQDPSEKLGCAFAGTPPANTSVSKIAPGSVAERNNIQTGFQLVTVNGQTVGALTESTFRESLKARPVRLLFQVPKKDQPLVESSKAPAGAVVFEVRLEDAATKLGCGFGGLPPDAVAVGKVSPGTFAERNKIQTGYLLVALNGIEMKELNPERFREILKARPVRLRLQIPQSEEKEKIVKEVVKQENAVTALQAIARGQRVRRQWRARAMQKAQVEASARPVADQTPPPVTSQTSPKTGMEALGEAIQNFVVEEGVPSLGLDFDMPPSPVVVRQVLPGSWAEGRVPLSSEIKSINGRSATSLDADGFKAELERRPLQLQVHLAQGDLESAVSQSPAQPQKTEGGRGSTLAHVSKAPSGQIGEKDAPVQDATSEGEAEHETAKAADPLPTTTMASPPVPSAGPAAGSSDFEHLQKDFDALSQKLQEREKELLTAEGELAKAKGEVQELRTKLALREKEKKDLLQDAKRDPLPSVSEVELDEVKGQLANALQDLAIARSQAEQLKQRTEELEDARKELMEKDVKLVETDRPGATSSAPPQSPDSAASFEVTPAYWEHVEIHALQEELAQRDAELKALRTDLAAAYAKLKEGDQKLRVTAPKSATTLGFRLQKWLVYEVVKGSWAESVGLKLGDRLQLVQEMQVTKMGKEQLKEAWSQRPLQLTFRAASKTEQEGMASTKIQANWRRKKAQEKVGQLGKAAGDLGPELDTFTLLAEVEDLGLTLELWPPAPKVLVCRVQREGWAMKAGIKAGYQLLMVQKQSLQSFQDRQSFRRLWKERPLELTLCPGSKEDVQRIASTKIQHGWRSREPKPKGVEMADQTKRAGVPMPLAAGEAAVFPAASIDRPWEKLEPNSLQQLQDELMQKQLELKKLKQDLVHSESSFEKSLEQISVESSESAVEVASLKAQLALEQSKVAKIQNEGASKATSAHAKFLVEQRKAETLETRLVETEVIHQEQISEITEFLEARRRELQLEDIDFSKLRHPPDVPNAPREVERLKAALAEEQERVSSAERKLVKGWSDQRAIDLKWQAEVAARDESLEAMQKEVSKAEWWASLSSSPELKDLVGLKTELEEERDKNLRTERRLEEVQADSKKGECEKLQASLNKEEARHLQLQLALTKAQIEDETLRNADLEIPTTPTDKAVKAEELLRLNLQLQELKGELQETKVQGPSRTAETRRKAGAVESRTSVPVVKVLSREVASSRSLLSRASLRGRASLTDDGLRTKLAVALMRALQDGSLQQHLDKAKTVPRSQVQALRQEVVQLRRQLRTAEVSGSPTPSTPCKGALRTGIPQSDKQKVNFLADGEPVVQAQEDFRQLMEEKEKLAADLARAQAKLKDYEEERSRRPGPHREALPEATARTEQKTEQAIHLNELAAKEPLLAQAREEARRAEEEHAAEKERWMKEMAELARPLDLQEEVSEARQLRSALEMRENVAAEFRKQLWEVREELQVAESMGFQPNKALGQGLSENAMDRALREEQDLAKHLRQELSEVETAAITTAEAAEARIIQIEALDRRGRMALHMAETAAEKEAALKDDAIKAACEAEAQVQNMLREVQRMQHEVYEQSQACYRESAVCDGLRRALMNSVEEEMAQEALHAATSASSPKSPRSPRPTPAVPSAQAPSSSNDSPPCPPQLGRGPSGTTLAFPKPATQGPCASFASRLSNREDLKHDLMSPSEVKSWMAQDPSTISQPSLLSAAAKEAASLRKEAEQLRHEVRHWRASRPLRADPTPPAGEIQTATAGTAPLRSEGSMRSEAKVLKNREAPSAQVPTLPEQPPPRPPLG